MVGYVGWRVGGVWLVMLVKMRSRVHVHSMADNVCTYILSMQESDPICLLSCMTLSATGMQ